jgi:hypothetical protein
MGWTAGVACFAAAGSLVARAVLQKFINKAGISGKSQRFLPQPL